MAIEMDYMEYSLDALAQANYVTSSSYLPTGGTITTEGDYTVHTFTTSGTFIVNTSGNIQVECWGGGGAGGASASYYGGGGGGGGGEYSIDTVVAVTAQVYDIVVGAGGTDNNGGDSTFASTTVVAKGGGGGGDAEWLQPPGIAGVGGSGGTGDIKYSGGNGSVGLSSYGGGGGGSGGTSSVGNTATSQTGAIAVTGGGGGGNGGATEVNGSSGKTPGGGGGGGGPFADYPGHSNDGGVGSKGKVIIKYLTADFTYYSLQSYSESTIKTQGSYSLKAIATTGALNATLTKTFASLDDLSGINTLKLDVYSSRTGSNLKFGLANVSNAISNANIYNYDFPSSMPFWTTEVSGTGVASRVTFDGKTCIKSNTGATLGSYAGHYKDVGVFTSRTVFSMSIYCDNIGPLTDIDNVDSFQFYTSTATNMFAVDFASNGLFVWTSTSTFAEVGTGLVVQDTWQEWTFDVDWTAKTVDVYLDKHLQVASVAFDYPGTYTDGTCNFYQMSTIQANNISYVDWIKVGSDLDSTSYVVTTETTPNITSAGAWQTITWDISGVADVDKNAIKQFIITPVNTDAENIFYVDNFYAVTGTTSNIKKYLGVAYVDLEKVSGILISNIKKLMGVE